MSSQGIAKGYANHSARHSHYVAHPCRHSCSTGDSQHAWDATASLRQESSDTAGFPFSKTRTKNQFVRQPRIRFTIRDHRRKRLNKTHAAALGLFLFGVHRKVIFDNIQRKVQIKTGQMPRHSQQKTAP